MKKKILFTICLATFIIIIIPNIAHAKVHTIGEFQSYMTFDFDTIGVIDGDTILINSMAKWVTLKGNPGKTYNVDIIGVNGGYLDIIIQDLNINTSSANLPAIKFRGHNNKMEIRGTSSFK